MSIYLGKNEIGVAFKNGIVPTGTINITENGTFNIEAKAIANVAVETFENEINAAYQEIIGEVTNIE